MKSPRSKPRTLLILAAAVGATAYSSPMAKAQQVLQWDSSGRFPSDPVEGSGNWDTTSALWSNGATDQTWNNDGTSIASFNDVTSPSSGEVTVTSPISANAIIFNAVSSGNIDILSGTTADPITLTGPTPTITDNIISNTMPLFRTSITASFAGNSGLTKEGPGNLIFLGASTYIGTTNIAQGTLGLDNAQALGASSNPLVLGTPGTATTAAIYSYGVTLGSFTISTNTPNPNILSIPNGGSLIVDGVTTVGIVPGANSGTTTTALSAGIFNMSGPLILNSSFLIGAGASTSQGINGSSVAIVDLTYLSQFTMSAGSGELDIGTGYNATGTLKLAQQANSITAAAINIGDGQATAGGIIGTSALIEDPIEAAPGYYLHLQADNIIIGATGELNSPHVTLANEAGTGAANLILNGGTINLFNSNQTAQPINFTTTGGTLINFSDKSNGYENGPYPVQLANPVTVSGSGTLTLQGFNSWSVPTNVQTGMIALATGGTLACPSINVSSGATFAAGAGAYASGTLGIPQGDALSIGALAVNSGGTLSLADGAIGTFTLNGTATLNGATLNFDLANTSADQFNIQGAAAVSGVNVIDLFTTTATELDYGVYALLSDPAGGLDGTFVFPNGLTTESILVGQIEHTATLTDTPTALYVTVPEPGAILLLGVSVLGLLRRPDRSKRDPKDRLVATSKSADS